MIYPKGNITCPMCGKTFWDYVDSRWERWPSGHYKVVCNACVQKGARQQRKQPSPRLPFMQ